MDLMTILGAAVGSGVVLFILHTGQMTHFLLNPEAIILIFGGTLGSVLISFPFSVLRHVPSALKMMLVPPRRPAPGQLIDAFVYLSEKSRKDGTSSLAELMSKMPHPFMSDGVQMLLDGLET